MPLSHDITSRVLASSLGEAAYKTCEKLLDAGHEAWWIGGAVRNMLTDKVPQEIDMATSALPEQVAALFPKSDTSAATLGTVIISVDGHVFEMTTFREDDEASDGRHPESVRFGNRDADAMRRDATVNAIYWNPVTRELFDPCDGEKDLKEALVRFIGEPVVRIRHDALRILRMVRLRATILGQYHPETYKALRDNAALTSDLSGTRVLQETEKLLQTEKPSIGLEDWADMGILKAIFPELEACRGVAQPHQYHKEGDVWNHLKACADSVTDDFGSDARIAVLFHDVGKAITFSVKERIRFDHHAEASAEIVGHVFRRLQMPSDRIKKIQWLLEHHMMMGAFETLSEVRKAHWYFHPWFRELLQLFWLDVAGTDPGDFTLYDWIVNDYNLFLNSHPRPEKPILSGDEIMAILGMAPGEEVGRLRKALLEAQISKKIQNKKDAIALLKLLSANKAVIDHPADQEK